ncbi:hypothetical protein [Endozoicomonas sp. YOMI1]|uniref:hypothetical protein n=1 Tax=Endozoicomonas sp. YOMI1 TaxID=2828739 RepID=UPI0021478194|nr:hypothetical protein [Endozoicomonas sp. YOMI1]
MNSANSVVDRFVNISDYLRSSEFEKNPTANIFNPLRKVSSEPAENNYLPLSHELKFEITQYLNLKDFVAFSSINVDNYLSLRSDDLLVKRVLKNEPKVRMIERLEDLNQKAQQYSFDINAKIKADEYFNAIIPPMAISPGPARLILNSNLRSYKYRSFDFVQLFQHLCMLAKDDSTDIFFRAHICSLAIDINNKMCSKDGEYATTYALYFLHIASQVKLLIKIEDKANKVALLANMIENNEIDLGRLRQAYFNQVLINGNEFNWDTFINGLRIG